MDRDDHWTTSSTIERCLNVAVRQRSRTSLLISALLENMRATKPFVSCMITTLVSSWR